MQIVVNSRCKQDLCVSTSPERMGADWRITMCDCVFVFVYGGVVWACYCNTDKFLTLRLCLW